MTARILLVDDVEGSRRLLQAKLTAEYYDVSTAADGLSALAMAADEPPDIILLDVIMPGMNGLQVCRKLKADETLKHIPVVLLTALDSREARLEGFRAGADEFLSKPIDDVFLFARLRSLARLKVMIDDLREREALLTARGPIDLAVINIGCHGFDALRLVAGLVSRDYSRQAPILAVVDPRDRSRLLKALDLGVNDLLPKPFDPLELRVRAKALIRRKRYADYLRDTVVQSMEMAVTDPLTGLNNRRYMMGQLDALFEECKSGSEAISLLMLDIDQFKRVNDTWGHARGDQVLKEVAGRIAACVRTMDLPCRYGGDEFVVVMPATHLSDAAGVAERIRCAVSASPLMVEGQDVRVSVSVGVSTNEGEEDRPESLLRRADEALYEAKFSGRNQVMLRATKR
jgi:two-component system cell cycle response regulator